MAPGVPLRRAQFEKQSMKIKGKNNQRTEKEINVVARGGKRKGAGRKRGVLNKLTADVKAAIQAAFDEAGGKEYLVKLAKEDPRTFCSLVGKLVPVAQNINMNVTHLDRMDEDELRQYIEERAQVLGLFKGNGNGGSTEH
jgi:hypothetical protein